MSTDCNNREDTYRLPTDNDPGPTEVEIAVGLQTTKRQTVRSRGQTIGRYVIIDKLGEGGMGVVYKAYDPELGRTTALKLLRVEDARSDASRILSRRLQREARSMAKLSHPNVVTVHDVGAIGDEVYIAMNFVDGINLRQWLDADKRSVADILDAFTAAGRGLAAAHRANVIHRDFKPENIIIGDDGRVQVLDFGLARSLDPDLDDEATLDSDTSLGLSSSASIETAETKLTRAGAIIGTPAYMAPEQFAGELADAAADQFSFCIALYEALYGERPFAGATFEQLAQNVADHRIREPRRMLSIPPQVRPVLLRGLAVDPDDRFATMDELIAALEADPRARRRRYLIAAAVAALAAVALYGFLRTAPAPDPCTGSDIDAGKIWSPTVATTIERRFVDAGGPGAAATFARVSASLAAYTHEWASLRTDACRATRVRKERSAELLDKQMVCFAGHLQEVDALVNLFSTADTNVVHKAVELVQELPELDRCTDLHAISAAVAPPHDPATRQRVHEVRAEIARADAIFRAGKPGDALALAERALAAARATSYLPVTAEALALLGELHRDLGDLELGEATDFEAIVAATTAGHGDIEVATWYELATLTGLDQKRSTAGLRYLELASATVSRLGNRPADRARIHLGRGNQAYAAAEYAHALSEYQRAAELREATFGGEHMATAGALNNVGNALRRLARFDEATANFERALAIYTKLLGDHHPKVAMVLTSLGNVAFERADLDAAADFYQRSLTIDESNLGPNSHFLAPTLNNLGVLLQTRGELSAARAVYERALAIEEATFGPDHPEVAATLNSLAAVLIEGHAYREAEPLLRRAIEVWSQAEKPNQPDHVNALINLGITIFRLGDKRGALGYLERGLEMQIAIFGNDHPAVAHSYLALCSYYRLLKHYANALAYADKALVIVEAAYDSDNPAIADALVARGAALDGAGRDKEAVAVFERVLKMRTAAGAGAKDMAVAEYALAVTLWQSSGSRERSHELARSSLARYRTLGANFEELVVEIENWLRAHPL